MDQNGPFWPEEAILGQFGPFRSANRTGAIPERKTINRIFTRLSRRFREISWDFVLRVSLFPQEKRNT